MKRLTGKLIEKSWSSFLLALELYNKPTIAYRTESYAILVTNAWELLLKAHLYETSGGKTLSIFRKKVRGQDRRSIPLDDCLRKVFPDDNNAVRKNIDFVSSLRNEATHLVIEDFSPYYSRVFQSCVLNYLNHVELWFKLKRREELAPGFLNLIVSDHEPNMTVIRKQVNRENYDRLLGWQERFRNLEKLGKEGAISIQYKIAIVKPNQKSDIVLMSGASGKQHVIVERTRDPDQTHPYRQKELLNRLSCLMPGVGFSTYDLRAYMYATRHGADNNEFHWKSKYGVRQYSELVALDIAKTMKSSPSKLINWRKIYGQHLGQHQRSWSRRSLRAGQPDLRENE